jgi:hypothetical protein
MNVVFHFIINVIIAILLKLDFLGILLVGFGGVLIDVDHILYMTLKEKIYSPRKMIRFHKKESKIMRPHFYFLHFIEIIWALMVIGYFINWYLFLIFIGFLLHWIADSIKYFYYYRSRSPWINYYSLIGYLVNYKNKVSLI